MMAGASLPAAVPVQWRRLDGGVAAPAAPDGLGFDAPATFRRLVANFEGGGELVVIGIQDQADRDLARRAIREAIAAELLLLSGLSPQRIIVHTLRGKVPWAELGFPDGPRRTWLAISHDGALSVAAISLHGPVGIDVTQIADPAAFPDWEPVARDYLGPDTAAALAALPPDERPAAFARAWSEREARLKYLGRELVEWSADGDHALDACRCLPLTLPEGYAGVLALPPA
ncbi:4'-phosphopantetheinyl transferase superfamily protein [Massilia sp. LXY-6]|uniref:4'-phosphopantetheinyl transferase superfamily protein n=1 Tax=Massilia sp. LXY-6 TaxID=3379823 RepID=UPI003EE325E5